jgi:hypothetical protein
VLPPPEGPEPGYIVVFIVLPARCSPCSPSSGHSQRPFGPNSSHPMASVLYKRRQLVPTVGPAGALASVFFRMGSLLASGERVISSLV